MTTELSVIVARWMNDNRMYSNPGIIKTIMIDQVTLNLNINETTFYVQSVAKKTPNRKKGVLFYFGFNYL